MKLRAGHHLLRLEVVTPANLGSAAGEATLDRPTQKEPWHELPYLPDSALKGVVAGRHGNVAEEGEEANREREPLYGSPDRGAERGTAGKVVFGNGELLAFPVPAADGGRVWVFPALGLARLLWLQGVAEPGPGVLRLLGALEARETNPDGRSCAAWPAVPELGPGFSWKLEPAAARAELEPLLRRYGGAAVGDGTCLVVSAAAAARLCRLGAEIRTLTALERQTHTVREGSLRAVELIPPGAVFVSFVSVLGAEEEKLEVALPDYVQLGAWEAQGFGWVRLSGVEDGAGDGAGGGRPAEASPQASPRPAPLDPAAIMTRMHQAIRRLGEAEPAVRKSAKAAIKSFGGRARFGGFEAALAFELAKAKPAHRRPGAETRAHRWLVATLLGMDPGPAEGPAPELLRWAQGEPFAPQGLAELRPAAFERWRWLRRFSELGLVIKEEREPRREAAG